MLIPNPQNDDNKRGQKTPWPQQNQSPHDPPPLLPLNGPDWHIWEVAMVLFVSMLLSFLPVMFQGGAANMMGLLLISYTLQMACFFLLPLINVWILHGQTPSALGVIRPRATDCLKIALPAGIIFYLLNVLTQVLVSVALPAGLEQEQSVMALFAMADNAFEITLLVLFVVLLAPVAEEMLFRAFLLPPLKRRYGRRPAFIIAACIFAGMHFNLWVFLPLFVGGLCFCWLYDKYGNLFYNIIAHATWNAIALSAYFIIAS